MNDLSVIDPDLGFAPCPYAKKAFKELSQPTQYADKLKVISERRALATKSDLQNSQLIKDIRVDKTQPKELKPNSADNNLAAY